MMKKLLKMRTVKAMQNPALSRIFIQLHITEHTGRGVPKIIQAYSSDNFRFSENSITVTIPYDRLGENVPVDRQNAPVESTNAPVNVPVRIRNKTGIEESILAFCTEPRGILEIAEFLAYNDKRTIRKYIKPLLEAGRLAMTIPDKPNSSKQKHIAIK